MFFKNRWFGYFVCMAMALCVAPGNCFAQTEQDSANTGGKNIFQQALKLIYRDSRDSAKQQEVLNQQSVRPFLKYTGKIIREIEIKEFGFEKTFKDTSGSINYFGTNILNKLHRNTRSRVIRNNLFIYPNSPLNPYLAADNERHLRELEYIQDARILVKQIPGKPDSIDLVVVTKDLFSINGELKDLSTEKIFVKGGDANVLGLGQKVELSALVEKGRPFGYGVKYVKNNLSGSFINAIANYSNVNPNIVNGRLNEERFDVGLERPLVSQYLKTAGNISYSIPRSRNYFNDSASQFYDYQGSRFDVWGGVNLGVRKYLFDNKFKNRKFLAIRFLDLEYSDTPDGLSKNDWRFQNETGLLASLTLFKQSFFKTNYLYGFGNTEDIPSGYNVSLTSGWYRIADLSRLYAGVSANKYIVSNRNDFIQVYSRLGGFLGDKQIQDANLMAGASFFSRILSNGDLKMRQFFVLNYTRQFNRLLTEPLQINNEFGLKYFGSDSAYGSTRISFHSESDFYLSYKLFGFKFSPFASGSVSVLKPQDQPFSKSDLYWGIGGGVRTRNENLVFGTVELRAVYFPKNVAGNQPFRIMLSANLKFRVNTNYINPPDLIRVNSDVNNEVYAF